MVSVLAGREASCEGTGLYLRQSDFMLISAVLHSVNSPGEKLLLN